MSLNVVSPDGRHTASTASEGRRTRLVIRGRGTHWYHHIRRATFTPDSRFLVFVAANEGGPVIQSVVGPARLLHDFFLVVVQLECRRLFWGVGLKEKRFRIPMVGDMDASVSPDGKRAMVLARDGQVVLAVDLDKEF